MDVIEAIHDRRSIGQVMEDMPETETIKKILEAARWAPNHHKTEPWRFHVLTGEGRNKLGEVYGQINIEKLTNPSGTDKDRAMERGIKKAKRSPVVIVNVVEPKQEDHIERDEEIAAVSCAVQNMLLTAHSLGLAAKWRTGKPNTHELMKKTFAETEQGIVLGYLYIGYPSDDAVTNSVSKKEIAGYTTWTNA